LTRAPPPRTSLPTRAGRRGLSPNEARARERSDLDSAAAGAIITLVRGGQTPSHPCQAPGRRSPVGGHARRVRIAPIVRKKCGRVICDGRATDSVEPRHAHDRAVVDPDLEQIESLAGGDSGLSRLMASLPSPEREAIERRVLQEQTYKEIATELECSEMVVRKRVSRGLGRLRENWMER
jgi:RNA polymerase sigma factor (sigma-70 family)